MKLRVTLHYTTVYSKVEKSEVERYVTLHTTLLCTLKPEKSEVELNTMTLGVVLRRSID